MSGLNPTQYGLNPARTISWVVNDGRASNNVSAAANTTVNIIATPPAPAVAAGETITLGSGYAGQVNSCRTLEP